MKKFLFSICIFIFISCSNEPSACIASEDFIKEDLNYPEEAEFSSLDCNSEFLADGSYEVLRKVTAKNAFGIKSSYVYKVKIKQIGTNWTSKSDWQLISIRSEEYK